MRNAMLAWLLALPVAAASGAEPPGAPTPDARRSALEQIDRLQAKLDRLRRQTNTEPFVLLHAQILEVRGSHRAALGLPAAAAKQDVPRAASEAEDNALRLEVVRDASALAATIKRLESEKRLRVVCRPSFTTRSGGEVLLQIGNEHPFPVPYKHGMITLDFKLEGIQLKMTPTAVGGQSVSLQVAFSYSEVVPQVNGKAQDDGCPTFKVRRADTRVELGPGEAILITAATEHPKGLTREPPAHGVSRRGEDGRRLEAGHKADKSDLVFLITPEIVARQEAHGN